MPKRKQKIEPWQVREKRKRSKQTLPPCKRYLICTEGKSEALYFAHYKSSTGPIVIALDKSDHKVSLVKKALEERNSRIQAGEFDEGLDEVWVVLDRDVDPSNRLDKSHFNQALNLAEKMVYLLRILTTLLNYGSFYITKIYGPAHIENSFLKCYRNTGVKNTRKRRIYMGKSNHFDPRLSNVPQVY